MDSKEIREAKLELRRTVSTLFWFSNYLNTTIITMQLPESVVSFSDLITLHCFVSLQCVHLSAQVRCEASGMQVEVHSVSTSFWLWTVIFGIQVKICVVHLIQSFDGAELPMRLMKVSIANCVFS